MKEQELSNKIEDLVKFLDKDRFYSNPQYPRAAIQAFTNPLMPKLLNEKISGGLSLVNIRSLGFNSAIGMEQLVFEFSKENSLNLSPNSILVLINDDGVAVAVIDNFNTARPNKHKSNINAETSVPFVFAHHTDNGNRAYNEELKESDNSKILAYLEKMQIGTGSSSSGVHGTFTHVTCGRTEQQGPMGPYYPRDCDDGTDASDIDFQSFSSLFFK
ncbi:MAG: hypothetical protein GY829_11510 [Gammaproteobacteria bacterium]|nr:hypothetical protein [Gammaproteobacteria bacterium]